MLRYVTIEKFSDLSGYSKRAIETKIQRGIWLEGAVWKKAPDGRVLISTGGYEQWASGKGYQQHLKQR